MDIGGVLYYLFGLISVLYICHFGLYLTGANLYDIWQIQRLRALRHRRRPYKPLVSVLVPAHNEEQVIERCLASIGKSTYRTIEIIVIDDASQDSTYDKAIRYKGANPGPNLQVIRQEINGGKARALNYALEHYAQGELIMTLDADSIIRPSAIANAVNYFVNPRVKGVAANVQIIDEPTVLGMLQKFEHMIGYRSKKTYSLFNCEFVIGGVASTYRMDTLRQVGFYSTDTVTEDIGLSMKVIANGNRTHRLVYAADVAAMTEGVDSFGALVRQRYRWKYGSLQNLVKYRHMIVTPDLRRYTIGLSLYRLPLAVASELVLLSAPIIWVYILYLTFQMRSLTLIFGAYGTITLYTLITIWYDEHCNLRERLRLSAYAPLAYFIFYVMDIVQLIAVGRCARRLHHLLRKKDAGSHWISPRRIGREVKV